MCPQAEREDRCERPKALGGLDPLERPSVLFPSLQQTMVKKLHKSSADNELQIPEYIRTPRAVLRTIRYLEEYLMEAHTGRLHSGVDPRFTECVSLPTASEVLTSTILNFTHCY